MSTKTISRTGIDHSHGRAALPLPSRVFTPDHTPADLDESPELRRLHEQHKARQERMQTPRTLAAEPPVPELVNETPQPLPVVQGAKVVAIITGFWGYHNLDALERVARKKPAHEIISQVCREYGVTMEEIKSPRRTRQFVDARQFAIWRIRNECPHLSLPQIGRLFDRDHTTALHSCRQIDAKIADGTLKLDAAHGGKEG